MQQSIIKQSFFWVFLFSLAGAWAWATTFYEQPLSATTLETAVIVRGHVGQQSYVDWVLNEDGSKRLHTFTEVLVDEVFKGDRVAPRILIREMGGEKDGVGMVIAGTATFERGEDVVLMLADREVDGSYPLMGLSMGKFNVQRKEDGQEQLVGGSLGNTTHPAIRQQLHDSEKEGGQNVTGTPEIYTIEKFRALVNAQKQIASHNDKKQNSTIIQIDKLPQALQNVRGKETGEQLAPSLQSSASASGENSAAGSAQKGGIGGYLIWAALVGLGVGFLALMLRRRRGLEWGRRS